MTSKPWREIITPHSDVLEGTFQQSEFAADITAVHSGKATPEYQDPVAFYETEVLAGPRAFLEIAQDFDDYPRAILKKLLREIEDRALISDAR